jgi:ferredoxin
MHGFHTSLMWHMRHAAVDEHAHGHGYHPSSHAFNLWFTRLELLVLRGIRRLTRHLPRVLLQKVVVPALGLPVAAPAHQVFPTEDALALVDRMETLGVPVGIGVCPCRMARGEYARPGKGLNATDMVIGDFGRAYKKRIPGAFRCISHDTARRLLRKFAAAGLVHMIFCQCPGADMQTVICNCDPRVCVPLETYEITGSRSFHKAPYALVYDPARCTGCSQCVPRCPVGARHLVQQTGKIRVDREQCINCGVCRACPAGANALTRDPGLPCATYIP